MDWQRVGNWLDHPAGSVWSASSLTPSPRFPKNVGSGFDVSNFPRNETGDLGVFARWFEPIRFSTSLTSFVNTRDVPVAARCSNHMPCVPSTVRIDSGLLADDHGTFATRVLSSVGWHTNPNDDATVTDEPTQHTLDTRLQIPSGYGNLKQHPSHVRHDIIRNARTQPDVNAVHT